MRVADLGSICSSSENIKWKDVPRDKVYKYIDLTSVDRDTKSIFEPQSITADTAPSRAQRIIRQGDILFATTRPTLRRLCIVPQDYDGEICSTGFCVLRPDLSKVLPKWVFILLSTDAFYDYIGPLQTGATYPAVTDKDVRAFVVPVPSLPEQQRIVDILDREFAKIDALKANAEKSLQAARDLFFQMLAHTFVNPSWSWKRIGDVFDTGAGGTPLKTYKEYYENGNIPWLRSGEVCKKYITETEMFITKQGMDNSSAKMFPENSVVVAMYGATAGQVGILHLETTTNQAVCGIFPEEDSVPEFIYYSLLNSKKGLVAQATGNAQPNISQIKIKNTPIPVISRKEQEEVVSNLDDLNEKCSTLQQNYRKTLSLCDDLKQALLRKAFNGEMS